MLIIVEVWAYVGYENLFKMFMRWFYKVDLFFSSINLIDKYFLLFEDKSSVINKMLVVYKN